MINRKYFWGVGVLLLIAFGISADPAKWAFDTAHSKVRFSVSHMVISEVEGYFDQFDGSVLSRSDDFTDIDVEFTIQTASINTANEKRDKHLRSPDFFDAATYPEIKFTGKSVKRVDPSHYQLTGDLSMHGVTKEVTLDVKYGGTIKDPWGNIKAGFKVTGVLDRQEWGLTYNSIMDSGGLTIGNDVYITCNVELIRK